MNLNFHQTFKPERKHITELLLLAKNNESYSLHEISMITGIPTGKSSGKVLPHLEYARFMGLIDFESCNGKYSIRLTSLGELVSDEDISLSEKLTLLLLHCMLIRPKFGADLWYFCLFKYVKKYGNNSDYSFFEREVSDYFLSKVNTSPLKGSYDEFFVDLNLLEFDKKNNKILVNKIEYDSQYVYLYAYVLYEYWDIIYPNQNEISSNEFDEISFHQLFGWTKNECQEVLEILSEKGIIRLNKQLSPFTILRLVDKNYLLNLVYSELF